jgi:hypothetical protein
MISLNKILLVIVAWPCQTAARGKPSSAICPSQMSNSRHRHPRYKTFEYISTQKLEVNWLPVKYVLWIVPLGGSFALGKGYHGGGNGNGNRSEKSLVDGLNLYGIAVNGTCCQPILVLSGRFPTLVAVVRHYFSIIAGQLLLSFNVSVGVVDLSSRV